MQCAAEAGLQQQQQPGQMLLEDAQQVVLGVVHSIVQGNSTVKVLKLEGVDAAAAEAIGKAVCGNASWGSEDAAQLLSSRTAHNSEPSCQLSLLVLNGMAVPVKALLGSSDSADGCSSGRQMWLHELDLISGSSCGKGMSGASAAAKPSSAKAGLPVIQQQQQQQQQQQGSMLLEEEHVVFLAELLPCCKGLRCLRMPLLAATVSEAAAERLVAAVLQLQLLEKFNGVPVQQRQTRDGDAAGLAAAEQQYSVPSSAGGSGSLLSNRCRSPCKQAMASISSSSAVTELISRMPSWQFVELAEAGAPESCVPADIHNSPAAAGAAADNVQGSSSRQLFMCLNLGGRQLGAPGSALLMQCMAAAGAAGAVGLCLSCGLK
jgi:hypothetical protein